MLSFEKPKSLIAICIILYEFQNLYVLFDTSLDDFRCLGEELKQILSKLIFQSQKLSAFLGRYSSCALCKLFLEANQ